MDFKLCVELWKIFTCREVIPMRTYPNSFSQFHFTKVKKFQSTALKGKVNLRSPSARETKCSIEQKLLRIPRASQHGGSVYFPGSKHFISIPSPSSLSLVPLCLIPSLLGSWPHKTQPLPISWYLFTGSIYFIYSLHMSHTQTSPNQQWGS